MFQNASTPRTHNPPRRGWSWVRVLLIGVVLFIATTVVLFVTGNPNLYPTVILIGNFLIPIVFVAFLYDHQHLSELTLETVGTSFCIGGVLGVLGAAVLESLLIPTPSTPGQGLSLTTAFLVGLIEEGCKIVAVIVLARGMRHDSEMDGLLLGGAVGMGFAALESTGYAFTAFLQSNGYVTASITSTVIRGLLAPFGHGVWTAILGAILFRQSAPNRFRFTVPVILAYLFVSVLHGLWDGWPNTLYLIIPPGIPISTTVLVLGILGMITLYLLYRRSLALQLRGGPPSGERQ